MGFSIEAVETKVGNLFAGKKKWLLIGGAVVLVAVFVLVKKKGANTAAVVTDSYPTLPADYTGNVGSGSGSSGGVTSDDLALIRDNFTQQLNQFSERSAAANDQQNAAFAQANEQQSAAFAQQTATLAQQTAQANEQQNAAFAQTTAQQNQSFLSMFGQLGDDFSQQIDHLTGVLGERNAQTDAQIQSMLGQLAQKQTSVTTAQAAADSVQNPAVHEAAQNITNVMANDSRVYDVPVTNASGQNIGTATVTNPSGMERARAALLQAGADAKAGKRKPLIHV